MTGSAAEENGFGVRIASDGSGWRVEILDPDGGVVSDRACRDGDEARTYASTINQHIYWLSEAKFRTYYQLPEPE